MRLSCLNVPVLVLSVSAVAIAPVACAAQRQPREPVRSVLDRVTSNSEEVRTNSGLAAGELLVESGSRTANSAFDSLADGLTDLAIHNGRSGAEAMIALRFASEVMDGDVRVTTRLERIVLEGSDAGIRGAALEAVAKHGRRDRTLQLLRSIAVMKEPLDGFETAHVLSVQYLCEYGAARGREILTELHSRNLVTNESASATLNRQVGSRFSRGCR